MENSIQSDVIKASAVRRFFAQFVAVTVKNMLLFDMGLANAFPAIIIPALTGISNEHNGQEPLTLTSTQVSWLGSSVFICEPLGSLLSGLTTDKLGRKRSMILVNIPFVIAWLMMCRATQIWHIFVANILLGLGVGLMESAVILFVGEICEPKNRGILIAYTNLCGTLGSLLVFILNTLMPWRLVALVCLFMPVFTVISLCFIPETPMWLLSKNRVKDAQKSLCWLRGWVQQEAIAQEFKDLQRYSDRSTSCISCIKQNLKCGHPLPTLLEKLKELKRKQTLKPLFIVVLLFIFAEFTGATGMSSYNVQIFRAYGSPITPDKSAAILSSVNNMANITFLCLIRFTGTRKLYLVMLTIVFLSNAIISGYGFIFLPNGYNSFDHTQDIPMENQTITYIPFFCIMLLNFGAYCGVNSIPWQLLSSIYPFKSRGVAAGVSASLDYVLSFLSTKSYYNLETSLSMPGISLLNCIIAAIGLVSMYLILPETENRSLEEIELHFSDDTKTLCDRKIARATSQSNTDEVNGEFPKTNQTVIGHESDELEINAQNGCGNHGFVNDV